MSKYLRCQYFKKNPWIKEFRAYIGSVEFDSKYRALYKYLSTLNPGQYFIVREMCRKNPENHDLVVGMCDIYYNMDFFVNLEYDEETDRIYIRPPTGGWKPPYHPPDVYSKIVKNPKVWGVDPDDL